jgi:homoserine trans-succinylase
VVCNIKAEIFIFFMKKFWLQFYRGVDKSLARPTSRCILFDSENISFDASLVIYINSTNIPPIMLINKTHKHQNLLSL